MKFHPTTSRTSPGSFLLQHIGPMLALACLLLLTACDPTLQQPPANPPVVSDSTPATDNFEALSTTSKPELADGPKFKPYEIDPSIAPYEREVVQPLPEGPKRGDMNPTSQATEVKPALIPKQGNNLRIAAALNIRRYIEIPNIPTSTCCPEPSHAVSGQTIMYAANTWAAFSTDGGNRFNTINVTSLFPRSEGGYCCDQILLYAPGINNFLWLQQYYQNNNQGINRLRLAAATPEEIAASNGTRWTYWDITSAQVGSGGDMLDHSDMALGNNFLYIGVNSVGRGRVVMRLPLAEIRTRSVLNILYTPPTANAGFSALSQDTGDEVFWGGFDNTSTIRIYNWPERSGTFSQHTLPIDRFPSGPSGGTRCSDGNNWSNDWGAGSNWEGCARFGDHIWVSWPSPEGGGFPHVHIRLVKVNIRTWRVEEQVQIWNPNIAFKECNIATNSAGELGMVIAFGGPTMFASSAVGVWGDFVVYYPRLSDYCNNTWGHYQNVRRGGTQGQDWTASTYLNINNAGSITLPQYIHFGR